MWAVGANAVQQLPGLGWGRTILLRFLPQVVAKIGRRELEVLPAGNQTLRRAICGIAIVRDIALRISDCLLQPASGALVRINTGQSSVRVASAGIEPQCVLCGLGCSCEVRMFLCKIEIGEGNSGAIACRLRFHSGL